METDCRALICQHRSVAGPERASWPKQGLCLGKGARGRAGLVNSGRRLRAAKRCEGCQWLQRFTKRLSLFSSEISEMCFTLWRSTLLRTAVGGTACLCLQMAFWQCTSARKARTTRMYGLEKGRDSTTISACIRDAGRMDRSGLAGLCIKMFAPELSGHRIDLYNGTGFLKNPLLPSLSVEGGNTRRPRKPWHQSYFYHICII